MPNDVSRINNLEARNTVFRAPFVGADVAVAETPKVSFPDMVRMLGEGIAAAQASLDRASAELAKELAETRIEVIPRVTERVDDNGNLTYEHAPAQQVSLLDIGIAPTFYQFSQATVEVSMDLTLEEHIDEEGKTRYGMFAKTSEVQFERKLSRDVKVSSRLTATLVPVPRPIRLDPARSFGSGGEGDGG